MSPHARRHWTLGGFCTGGLLILGLLREVAATRQSYLEAGASRDILAEQLSATQDTLAAVRAHDHHVTHQLKACRRRSGQPSVAEPTGPIGPPEPAREGILLKSIGHAFGAVGRGIAWIFGG